MKHAYCIMVHNEPKLLSLLVRLIDDERNDIFIHVDKKSDESIFKEAVIVKKSRIFFVEQRINVVWGYTSQLDAEFALFELAKSKDIYGYYHLLSGADLPLKSQDYIHNFFDVENCGKEFVGYFLDEASFVDIDDKTKYYYLVARYRKNKNVIKKNVFGLIRESILFLEKRIHIKRSFPYKLYKGPQWISITENFCSYLLKRKNEILKTFKYTFCPDEIFVQSELKASPFASNIYDFSGDTFKGCARLIDWERSSKGSPYVWREEDFESIKKSDKLFARKFSSNDERLLQSIEKMVLGT